MNWKIWAAESKECVLSNEETQFLWEISKIVNVMHENNSKSGATFLCGPFSVNPHSCDVCTKVRLIFALEQYAANNHNALLNN